MTHALKSGVGVYLLLKAQNMVPSEDMWHVSRGNKCVLKLVNFLVQNL